MERRTFVTSSVAGSIGLWANGLSAQAKSAESSPETSSDMNSTMPRVATRKILIAGGNFNTNFIRYMASLTGKTRPKILYLPTASADHSDSTLGFFKACAPLNVEPSVQNVFIE